MENQYKLTTSHQLLKRTDAQSMSGAVPVQPHHDNVLGIAYWRQPLVHKDQRGGEEYDSSFLWRDLEAQSGELCLAPLCHVVQVEDDTDLPRGGLDIPVISV